MKFLSLFRGINVSGKNIIKMEALRKAMSTAGFENVQTYIQSGNVVFESRLKTALEVSDALEKLVKKEFGHEITILTVSRKELTAAIDANPFIQTRTPEESGFKKLHLAFLSEEPSAENVEKLKGSPIAGDELKINGKILYIRFDSKQSDSKLSNTLIESKLKVRATMRNWNTILRLEEILQAEDQ